MAGTTHPLPRLTRRGLLAAAGLGSAALLSHRSLAQAMTDLALPGGPGERALTTAFPQKGQMILQRTRPPLLETPWEVFDKGVFTPNDQFYVRWHWAVIPTEVDVTTFRLKVHGHVSRPLSLTLNDVLHSFPRVEMAAVNQCSGNSRGLFQQIGRAHVRTPVTNAHLVCLLLLEKTKT